MRTAKIAVCSSLRFFQTVIRGVRFPSGKNHYANMLNTQRRKQILSLIKTFRVEIYGSEIEEGYCRSLKIGNIWGLGSVHGEAWAFDYHKCSSPILLTCPELALMDSDGGYESAWQIMQEIFFKFYESNKHSLSDQAKVNELFKLFIQNIAARDEGYIYFLKKHGDDKIYKIGRSKSYPERIKKLEVKLPFDVEPHLICYSNDHKKSEKLLHSFFSNKRLKGEWFSLENDDISLVYNQVFCRNMLLEKIVIDNRKTTQ